MSGQLIGQRYRILRKIGEGGMAIVYLAVDEKLGRDIAIKILRERYENHEEIRIRFQHEARAISAFDHPNILKIYDFSGEDSKQLWIVTELIHGRNLAQILETTPNGWLHPVIAASIVREICRSLHTAHEHGIVHRDVKPENVMITHQGIVKLMDFGIAKIQRITSMTQTGMFMGSPSYMSPEQVRGRDIDERSDIYSLGVLFYELITGKLPYTGSSTADIAIKILAGEFIHPQYIMAGVPDQLCQLIVKCMEVNPDARPSTIDTIGGEIDRVLTNLSLDSSTQELEKCFKDPKAYGERLARILKITDAGSSKQTVVVSPIAQWNNEAIKSPIPRPDINGEKLPIGSFRRDHQLPPNSIPHLRKNQTVADHIAAHLPERRQQQRGERKLVKFEPTRIEKNQVDLLQQEPPKVSPKAPIKAAPQTPPQKSINRKVREVPKASRIVPLVPKLPQHRRPVHKVRYIVHETPYNDSMGFFTKLFVASLIAAALGIVWAGMNKISSSKNKNLISHVQKAKKSTVQTKIKPNAETLPKIEEQKTDSQPIELVKEDVEPTKPAPAKYIDRYQTKNTEKAKSSSATGKESNQSKSTTKSKLPTQPISEIEAVNKNKSHDDRAHLIVKPVLDQSDFEDPTGSLRAPTPQTNTTPGGKKDSATNKSAKEAAVEGKGQVAISSAPAAEVYIDGKKLGTTNDQGTSSDWLELAAGQHKLELKRTGFATRTESIIVTANSKDRHGPFTLTREATDSSKVASYRLTITSNRPPVEITILNIESQSSQNVSLTQASQILTLNRGIYEVTMTRKGETKKRRIDLNGVMSQITISADFKE